MLFRRPVPLLIAAFLFLAGLGGALVAQMESAERGILPIDSSGTLEISGIKVDVGGKDAESARFAGWRIAQREGFKALWAKMNKRPVSQAPNLTDSTLDGLVSSIVVEQEQIGPNRYIATLGVLFDRARAGALLGVAVSALAIFLPEAFAEKERSRTGGGKPGRRKAVQHERAAPGIAAARHLQSAETRSTQATEALTRTSAIR